MIFLDWETYYNSKTKVFPPFKGVTLESYIRDPQFAFVSVSVAVDDRPRGVSSRTPLNGRASLRSSAPLPVASVRIP